MFDSDVVFENPTFLLTEITSTKVVKVEKKSGQTYITFYNDPDNAILVGEHDLAELGYATGVEVEIMPMTAPVGVFLLRRKPTPAGIRVG